MIIDCDYQSFNTPAPCNVTYKINNNKLDIPFKHIGLIIGHMPIEQSYLDQCMTVNGHNFEIFNHSIILV